MEVTYVATVNDYARTTWQTGDVIDATKMNNIETQLDAVTDNARDNGTAPVFSTTKTYAVGEHVLYNGEVYKCKTAVTNAGAWVASNWVKAYLSSDMEGEVSELKSAFDEKEEEISVSTTEGGFTGNVGDEIEFNTIAQYKRTQIVPEQGVQYKISFWNRASLTTPVWYVYTVNEDNIITGRYCEIVNQPAEQHEIVIRPKETDAKIWIKCAKSTLGYNIGVTKITTNISRLTESVAVLSDDIGEINKEITAENHIINNWEMGSFNAATGEPATSTAIIRNIYHVIPTITTIYKAPQGYLLNVYGWDDTGYIGYFNGTEFKKTGSALNYYSTERKGADLISAGATKIKLAFKDASGTALTPSDGAKLIVEQSVISLHSSEIDTIKTDLNTVVSKYNHGIFDIKRAWFADYYTGLQQSYSNLGNSTEYADVIAAFDALMDEAPGYIIKTALGTASGTDASGNSYIVYEYTFKPIIKTSPYYFAKTPKLYMDGAIHGFEKNSTYGLYYFLKDVVEHFMESRSLAYIRSQVEMHIIPVSNPYGFDNNTYTNGNNVNINRNFAHPGEWEVITEPSSEVNGLEAFDQPESAIIRDWLLNAENDILMYFNCHTNGNITTGYPNMNPCMTSNDRNDAYFDKLIGVFANHIEIQTIMLPAMYQSINPSATEMCGTITTSATATSTKGTASGWADTMRSILAMTLEVFNGLRDESNNTIIEKYSEDSKKICSEIMGNLFMQILSEYSPY